MVAVQSIADSCPPLLSPYQSGSSAVTAKTIDLAVTLVTHLGVLSGTINPVFDPGKPARPPSGVAVNLDAFRHLQLGEILEFRTALQGGLEFPLLRQ